MLGNYWINANSCNQILQLDFLDQRQKPPKDLDMRNFTGNLRGGICNWVLAKWSDCREGIERRGRGARETALPRTVAAKGRKERIAITRC